MQRILESPYAGPEIALVWHAGEPLTLPTGWYDEATVILHRSLEQFNAQGLDYTQHVQTNATLINDGWCDCFRRNKIVVGIRWMALNTSTTPTGASATGAAPTPWR